MRVRALLFAVFLARFAAAQAPATTTVSGVVYDSLARAPLAGALVQLVGADTATRFGQTSAADQLGRFLFSGVPNGRYMLGFFHPMLDSLVVEAPLREVLVERGRAVRADLAIPSAGRLRAAICAASSPGEGADTAGAVVAGVVRHAADGSPASGVAVAADWLEYTLTTRGMARSRAGRVATTGENGWFAMCNVPKGGTIALVAGRGADSTDVLEVQVPADGFLRKELYLGSARTVVIGDTTRADTLAPAPRRIHLGDVRLTGRVLTAEGARPVAGAQVGVLNGPRTRTNERGEWTLVDAPPGTRTLEVRAVTYYPVRRVVDVLAGAPPVNVALSTLKATLDTVKVTASRLRGKDIGGFMERKRSGMGRYLTDDDVARRNPIVTSDLYRQIPGLRLELNEFGERVVTMRGAFGQCTPSLYLDGSYLMPGISIEDLDGWVHPDRIAGIEVYPGAGIPPQFQQGLSGCGSIVIWTK